MVISILLHPCVLCVESPCYVHCTAILWSVVIINGRFTNYLGRCKTSLYTFTIEIIATNYKVQSVLLKPFRRLCDNVLKA